MKKLLKATISLALITIFSLGAIAQNYSKLSDFPEHIKKRKPFKRFAWDFEQRAFPYDTVPFYYANEVANAEMKRIAEKGSQNKNQITWYPKGPVGVLSTGSWSDWGIVSGRVRAIAVHPTDPETVYIGAASGGLWKTINGGETWIEIGSELESLSFGAIAIDPVNTEVIYVGSGEPCYTLSSKCYGGRGLFMSSDGGNTWDRITNDFDQYTHFSDITVSPHNPYVLLAALTSGSYNLGNNLPNEGIWKSMDAGLSWTKTLDLTYACDVMFHPDVSGLAYTSIGGQHDGSGFYKSTDMGDTWTASNNGIPDSTTISRMLFDISLSDTDIFYAVAFEPDTGNLWWGTYTNAYKSINGGQSWQQISEDVPLGGDWGGWYDMGNYCLCIAVDPLNSNHVFIGNVELHEAMDGENFSPVRPYGGNDLFGSIAHVDYHQLVYAPSNPNYLYIGNDGGVYQSTDGGITAESRSNGLETFQFYRIGSHPWNPDSIIGGLQDNGTVLTGDGGTSWKMVMRGDGMECFFDYANPKIVYASYFNGEMQRSNNGGNSFTPWGGSIDGAWLTPFFLHPFGHDTLYGANFDIMKKRKYWAWQTITNDLSPVLINALAQSRINPNNMILAGHDEELYGASTGLDTIPVMISTDGGYNWTNVTANIPGDKRWISRVVTHPNDENIMYVVRNGFSEGNKIYRTTDLGETWTNVSGDLPDIPCNDLFIDPEMSWHHYVATDLGVYFSDNEGETWTYEGEGMPFVPVMDFDYVHIAETRYLRIATYGRSVYETYLPPLTRIEEEARYMNSFNVHPNPFRSQVILEYNLNQQGRQVQIHIYNQMGKKVRELQSRPQQRGKQLKIIELSNLSPGVYFCILKTNHGIQTKKMIRL